MSLTDDQIKKEWSRICSFAAAGVDKQISFARAIEAPLLKRIAELEQRNSDLYEDVKRFRAHALNEKEARMALERELEAVRKDAERWRTFLNTRPASTHEVICQAIDDAAKEKQ